MGREIVCNARHRDQSSEGKALLESDHVLFRGAFRAKVPLKELTGIEVADGWLVLGHQTGDLALELGDKAADWEKRIRNPRSLIDKLGVKPGARVSVIGVRDEAFWEALRGRTPDVAERSPAMESDLVFVQIDDPWALGAIASMVPYLKQDGGLWVVHPKGRKDLRDVDVMAAGKEAGLVDVKVSSFSNTLTALKFVIPVSNRKK